MKPPTASLQTLRDTLETAVRAVDRGQPATPLLEELARAFQCQWAVYWKFHPDERVLRSVPTWADDPKRTHALRCDTESRSLATGEGMPGAALKSRRALGSNNLVRDMALPRSLLAKSAGLSSGLWVPILIRQQPHGVIEFLAHDSSVCDQQILHGLMALAQLPD